MAYQSDDQGFGGQGFRPRQMFDVSNMNIKCCDCGLEIKELPFNPDPNRLNQIRCRECMRKRREQFRKSY